MYIFNTLLTGQWAALADVLRHLILPAVALGTIPLAIIARMTRSSLLEVLGLDYVRTARAKGLRERSVVIRHGMRNALLPVVTVIGLSLGAFLSGAILTETIFNLTGMGRTLFEAITGRDYIVIQGVTIDRRHRLPASSTCRGHVVRRPRSADPPLMSASGPPPSRSIRRAEVVVAARAGRCARHAAQHPSAALRRGRVHDPCRAHPHRDLGAAHRPLRAEHIDARSRGAGHARCGVRLASTLLGCPADQPQHIMGLDSNLRDEFSRVIYGSRVSLQIGIVTVGFAIVVGTFIGAIAGYAGRLGRQRPDAADGRRALVPQPASSRSPS